jgi:hypothetical protein
MVPAVKRICETPVILAVFIDVGVEENDRHPKVYVSEIVLPRADANRAVLDQDLDSGRERMKQTRRVEVCDWLLALYTLSINDLLEIAFTPQHTHPDHWHVEIRAGPQHVSGEYAESPGVRWDAGIESYFHGEVGDAPCLLRVFVGMNGLSEITSRVLLKLFQAILRTEAYCLSFKHEELVGIRRHYHAAHWILLITAHGHTLLPAQKRELLV